jgi:hypothetical protein
MVNPRRVIVLNVVDHILPITVDCSKIFYLTGLISDSGNSNHQYAQVVRHVDVKKNMSGTILIESEVWICNLTFFGE